MIALLLVAAALGVSNLAASVGIGVSGVRAAVRVRVALVFGLFEAGMPVLGMVAGHTASAALGASARLTGGILLAAVGCYQVRAWYRERAGETRAAGADGTATTTAWGSRRLLVSGLALSLDNLVVGFALGTDQAGLAVAAAVIGLISVAMSLLGLEAGAKLGAALGQRGVLIGGGVLAGVGILVAAGRL